MRRALPVVLALTVGVAVGYSLSNPREYPIRSTPQAIRLTHISDPASQTIQLRVYRAGGVTIADPPQGEGDVWRVEVDSLVMFARVTTR